MKTWLKLLALVLTVLVLAGCVTSYYKNEKGEECKRQYFTTFGIAIHKCGEVAVKTVPAMAAGSGGISAQQTQGGPISSGRDLGVSVQPIVTPTYTAPRDDAEEATPAQAPAKDLPMGPIASLGGEKTPPAAQK